MNYIKKLAKDSKGAIAMITVIFISIILSIMVTGFVRVMIANQRESIDDDLTTRAFYAAESGVEDARVKIKNFLQGRVSTIEQEDCGPNRVLSAELDSGYSCQIIDTSPSSYRNSLTSDNSSSTIPLKSDKNFNKVRLQWHLKGEDQPASYNLRDDKVLPRANGWSAADYLPILRVNVFRFKNSDINRDTWRSGSNSEVFFLNPANKSAGASTVTNILSGSGGGTGDSLNDANFYNIKCKEAASVANGQFACQADLAITSSSSWSYFVRLKPLYGNANIRVSLITNTGVERAMKDAQALVDVTGYAGDVYRRVEARIPLTPELAIDDYALLSGERICKTFYVTNEISDYLPTVSSSDNSYLCPRG